MAKQQLNHDEVTYGVRFCWYDHPSSEGDKRFESPRRVKHVNTYGDRGVMPSLDKAKNGVAWSLYRAKDFINRFMNCGLPEKLMKASEFELVKMMVMTDKISIDQEGQIAISWHDLDLWVEIIRLDQVDSSWKVGKTMARWEVLAKSFDEPFFPTSEMDSSYRKGRLEVFLDTPEALASPFVCPMKFREGLATLIQKSLPTEQKIDGASIDCFGMIIAADHALIRVVPTGNSGYSHGVVVELTGETFKTLMHSAVIADGVTSADLKRFWVEPDNTKALHDYFNWFKTKFPELR